jgi:hypothetical protein
MNRTQEISITALLQPKIKVSLRNNISCMLIRMIGNKHSTKNDFSIRTYFRQQGGQKVTKTQPYSRLFSVMIFESNQPTSKIAYIMEDDLNHKNLFDFNRNIRDNGGISIGTVIRLHHVKPIERMMADDCPALVTSKPSIILQDPIAMNEVKINNQVAAGVPTAFVLSGCSIDILDSQPVETGCGGLFCDKQRIREIGMYNQGCCCFKFCQRRANMEIIHTVVINHISLDEPLYIEEYSSARFSLLFQTGVLSAEISKESVDMTDLFDELDDSIQNGVQHINNNGGFTVIGWYKRGQIQDRTVVIQNSNDQNSRYGTTNNQNTQVDNSEIKFHPCVIRPTEKFFFENSTQATTLNENKFNVDRLINIA